MADALPRPQASRPGRPGRGLPRFPPGVRRVLPAGRLEDLLARVVPGRRRLRRGHGPGRGRGRAGGADPAGQPSLRPRLRVPRRRPRHGHGMDRRLRPPPGAHGRDPRAEPGAAAARALEVRQRRDPHGRPGAAAAEAGGRHLDPAGLPGRPGGRASGRDGPRRPQAVEHHAEADGDGEGGGHRLGDGPHPRRRAADVVAGLRRAGGAGGRCRDAAGGPRQPRVRAGRDAGRPRRRSTA